MLKKSFKKIIVATLFIFVFSSAAMALSPHNALSSRPAESFYATLCVNDLNGLLQDVFSPANLTMVKSMMDPEEAGVVDIIALFVSQIPANTVVINAGMTGEMIPFVQVAASMPASVRSKLDSVADGSASGADIVSLLLGDAALMFAGDFMPEVQKGEKGPFYSLAGMVAIAAKEDLLLIAASQEDLEASVDALENEEKRLAFKRRFDSPNYLLMHIDYNLLPKFGDALGDETLSQMKELSNMFKAPLEVELGFTPKPGSFLISGAANAMEAVVNAEERFKDKKPVEGGGLFMAGGGKMLIAFSSPISFSSNDLKMYPKLLEGWQEFIAGLAMIDLSESDIESMLDGSISLALGSDAKVMGMNVPGGYIALTGREGAAIKIVEKLMGNPMVTGSIPLVPLKVDDWDALYTVHQEVIPMPILFGVMKDTLFLGFLDSEALGKKPDVSPEVAKMLEAPLFGAGVIDAGEIWNLLRKEVANPNSLLAMIPEMEVAKVFFNELLGADLSIPLIKIWATEIETTFIEFSIVDVPEEKQLIPRIMKLVEMTK